MFEISKELEKRQVKSVEQIKVIEYISNFGDGGAETLVKDYVRLIDRKRFEPIVVTLRGEKNRQIGKHLRKIISQLSISIHDGIWLSVSGTKCLAGGISHIS